MQNLMLSKHEYISHLFIFLKNGTETFRKTAPGCLVNYRVKINKNEYYLACEGV
jgi:hypothetical protein